jgi:hypothetical protein
VALAGVRLPRRPLGIGGVDVDTLLVVYAIPYANGRDEALAKDWRP